MDRHYLCFAAVKRDHHFSSHDSALECHLCVIPGSLPVSKLTKYSLFDFCVLHSFYSLCILTSMLQVMTSLGFLLPLGNASFLVPALPGISHIGLVLGRWPWAQRLDCGNIITRLSTLWDLEGALAVANLLHTSLFSV